MSYSEKTKELVHAGPKTLGNRLGRWAIHRDFPVAKVIEGIDAADVASRLGNDGPLFVSMLRHLLVGRALAPGLEFGVDGRRGGSARGTGSRRSGRRSRRPSSA